MVETNFHKYWFLITPGLFRDDKRDESEPDSKFVDGKQNVEL